MRTIYRIQNLLKKTENPLFLPDLLYWPVYRFNWNRYNWIFQAPLSKWSPLISIIGYFIFLNDVVTDQLGFDYITAGKKSFFDISFRDKLVFLYFGVLLISAGRILYLLRRPMVIRQGGTQSSFIKFALENYTLDDFFHLQLDLRENGHRTMYGKGLSSEWEDFEHEATGKYGGEKISLETVNSKIPLSGYKVAKEKYESYLISLLMDRYAEYSARRKLALAMSILLAGVGYVLFLIPNIDLLMTISSDLLNRSHLE